MIILDVMKSNSEGESPLTKGLTASMSPHQTMNSSFWEEWHAFTCNVSQQTAQGIDFSTETLADSMQDNLPYFSAKLFSSQQLGIILWVLWVL